MTQIQLREVALLPERTLGDPIGDAPLHGRLTFGWDVLPADHEYVPKQWSAYAAGRDFRLLLLVCSFRPETPDLKGVFRHASLGVALFAQDPLTRPVARLIDPGERTAPAGGSGSGVTFALKGVVLEAEVQKPSGSIAAQDWIVRGHGASQPDPQWEFRPVKRHPLVGDHPVAALVELVAGQVNTAEVLFAAELEHRKWGLRRYRARLTPTPHTMVLASPQ